MAGHDPFRRERAFLERGYSVLLYDYRGYGNSQGEPSEEGTYLDAEAAYRTAANLDPALATPLPYSTSNGLSIVVQ